MATTKITDLTAYTDPVNTDVLPIVDVTSDVTKKVSIANVMKNASQGTAAAPGIAFDGDSNTGIYSPGANQVAISTDGTQRLLIDSAGAVTIAGDLTVNGTTTNINTSNLIVEDKNIVLGDVAVPTDVTADGGGITLLGTTNKTINWVDSTDAWTSSERFSYPLGSAAAPTLTFTGDANTGIYSPGADQVAISTNGTQRATVDSSGRLLVGTSTSTGANATTQIRNDSSGDALAIQRSVSGAAAARLIVEKSRGTAGSPAVVQSGDVIFEQKFSGYDGSSYIESSRIFAAVDGTPGANDMPGRLVFSTTADSASSPTERMRIDSSGRVGIGTTSPSTELHVFSSTEDADLQVESTFAGGDARLNLYANSGGTSQIRFGDESVVNVGALTYDHTNDSLAFRTNAAERLRITSAGLVGIGTSSPTQRLQVTDGSLSNFYVAPGYSGGSGTLLATGGSEYLAFATNGLANERLRITSAGNVGIGTTSPSSILSLGGNLDFKQSSNISTTTGYLNLNPSGSLILDGGSGSTVEFRINTIEAARIDSSRRLLVGTSSVISNNYGGTAGLFQVARNDFLPIGFFTYNNGVGEAGYCPYVELNRARGTQTSPTAVDSGDDLGLINFYGHDGSTFIRAATIKSVVDGATGSGDMPGRLVFSTTADGASSPTERMRLAQDGRFNLFNSGSATAILQTASAAGTTNTIIAGRYNATNNNSGSDCFYVFSNGNVQNTNNSYTAISDIKLKENVVDAGSQWSDLKALRVRNYNLKEGQTHKQIGLIAQEVEPISPGLVYESPDRDKDGNDLGTVTKSVNYSVLYMKAVKALQEAMERIETLEAKVAALESA